LSGWAVNIEFGKSKGRCFYNIQGFVKFRNKLLLPPYYRKSLSP
jgi:hypothetical protein